MATKTAKQQVGISERALIQRINRKLKAENQQLRTARGFWDGNFRHDNTDLGRHYIIDTYRNYIVDTRVDLEFLGRKLKVIQPWEKLQAEE